MRRRIFFFVVMVFLIAGTGLGTFGLAERPANLFFILRSLLRG